MKERLHMYNTNAGVGIHGNFSVVLFTNLQYLIDVFR